MRNCCFLESVWVFLKYRICEVNMDEEIALNNRLLKIPAVLAGIVNLFIFALLALYTFLPIFSGGSDFLNNCIFLSNIAVFVVFDFFAFRCVIKDRFGLGFVLFAVPTLLVFYQLKLLEKSLVH